LEEKLRDAEIDIEELKRRGGEATTDGEWKGCWKGGHDNGKAFGRKFFSVG
jgi:hypothetical protein